MQVGALDKQAFVRVSKHFLTAQNLNTMKQLSVPNSKRRLSA